VVHETELIVFTAIICGVKAATTYGV